MNILFISVRADIGGGPKHLLDLASYLKTQKNINLTIASPDEEPFADQFKNIADHYIKIPKRSFSPYSYLKLLIHCKKNNINLVHSHGRGAGVYSRLLTLFGLSCVHTFHGIHMEPTITGKLKYFLDYLLHTLTGQYICVSEGEKEKFRNLGFSENIPLIVIENGIDHLKIKEEFLRDRQKNTQFVLGTLARLHYQKGIDLLIGSVKRNKTFFTDKNIIIKVAGDGPDREILNQQIKESNLESVVQLCGPTHKPIKFLASLDCYISFARWEGLPLSVLEAKACGLPTLLSKVTGHDEFDHLFENDETFISILSRWTERLPEKTALPAKYTLEEMATRTYQLY